MNLNISPFTQLTFWDKAESDLNKSFLLEVVCFGVFPHKNMDISKDFEGVLHI